MRLFAAIELPGELRGRLWAETASLREADAPVRWVGPERLHLTLKFIGEVDEAREAELSGAVASVAARHAPVPVHVAGLGAFPSTDRPRVLWIGVEPRPSLLALQADLEEALASVGVDREDRDFHPHVTLGRVRRRASGTQVRSLGGRLQGPSPEADHRADAVYLMESRPGPEGARYSVRSAHALEG